MEFRKYTALYEKERMEKIAKAITSGTREDKFAAKNSIQAFWNAPMELGGVTKSKNVMASLQAYTTTSDIPDMVTQSFDVFAQLASFDDRYNQAFKIRSFDSERDYFEIVDVVNYFTFDELPEGAQVPIRRFTGSKAAIYAKTYADSVGWTQQMLEDRRFSEMVAIAEQMRLAFYTKKARLHYALLVDGAATGGTVTWQGSGTTPADVFNRDVTTISKAVNDIKKATKDLGFGDVASQTIYFYGSPYLEGRFQAATSARNANNITPTILPGSMNVVFMPTYELKSSAGTALPDTTLVAVLPGHKIQRGDKVLPQSFFDEDIITFSNIQSVRARFGAGVGETAQLRQVQFA
jgi:hypothetical protein